MLVTSRRGGYNAAHRRYPCLHERAAMSEQTHKFFEHLENSAKRIHAASLRALLRGKPAVFLPIPDELAYGILLLLPAGLLFHFAPLILTIQPEALSVDFITRDVLPWIYCGALATSALVAALAARLIYTGSPTWAVVDAEAEQVLLRRLWGKSEAIPLVDIDSVKQVRDGSLGRYGRYFALVFAKRFFRPAMRLSRSTNSEKEFDEDAEERLLPLRRALSAVTRDAPPPREAGFESHCWYASGHLQYKLYHSLGKLFRRLVVGNAVTVLVLYGLFSYWREDLLGWLRGLLQGYDIGANQIVEVFWWLLAARIVLDVVFTRVALRIDSDSKTIFLFRFLGLWRSDYGFDRFDGFSLLPTFETGNRPALLLTIRGLSPPLLLSDDNRPEQLQRMLYETADLLGVDAWGAFTTCPQEYSPPVAQEKPPPEWLVKRMDRMYTHLRRIGFRLGKAAEKLDDWTKRRWPD